MKMRKKVTILAVICLAMILIPVLAVQITMGQDLSKRVFVSDFSFTDGAKTPIDTLTPQEPVSVKCSIERTKNGEGAQSYVLALAVYDDGELISLVTEKGTVSLEDGVKELFISSDALGESVENCTVTAHMWADIKGAKPLAQPATFGTKKCDIDRLLINGNLVEAAFDQNGELVYSFDALQSEIPQIKASSKDLASSISITNDVKLPGVGEAVIQIASHDGSDDKEYKVKFNLNVPTKTAVGKAIHGIARPQYYTNFNSVLPSGDGPVITINSTEAYNGNSTSLAYIEFDLSQIDYDNMEFVKDTNLNLTIQAADGVLNRKIDLFVCTQLSFNIGGTEYSWKEITNNYGNYPAFNSQKLNTGEVVINNSTYERVSIPIDYERIKDEKSIVIAIRAEYVPYTGTQPKLYIDGRTAAALPTIEVNYYE